MDNSNTEEFNWIKARKDVGLPDIEPEESFPEKCLRKFSENPLVPIGTIATTVFLTLGLRTLGTGDSRKSQLMMRGRVLAQGFTIAALIAGLCIKARSMSEDDIEK